MTGVRGILAFVAACALVGQAAERPASAGAAFALQREGTAWWLVSPQGKRFFSTGVCCAEPGPSRERYDPENPAYASWRYYDQPGAWADTTLKRLKSWRFTTLGGWSDLKTLNQSREQTLYLTPVLHIGSTAGAPWWDMWDPKNIARMEEVARTEIAPLRGDARVIGYYSDNELGWWNVSLWKMTLEQAPASGQRQRLIRLLRDTYQNDWQRLTQDFDPERADSWRTLERGGMLYYRPGGNGLPVMRRFLSLIAERYYLLMRGIIHKYDPRALYLGDRYQSYYYPEVPRAAAAYVDAISSNLNAHWNDGTFLRCYLDTLHALTGKPVLVSEFYLAAVENRSGNRNSKGVFPAVPTQAERATAAVRTLTDLARLPYVVGADWFQYADEPTHGRDDGENYNFGLVDIHDQPYAELVAALAGADPARLKAQGAPARADASQGIPPAPADPFAHFSPNLALKHWDRERGFVKPASPCPLADLYVCWSERALYLGVYALDVVEAELYRWGGLPKAERALWTVRVGGKEVARARLGGGREAMVSEPRVRVENLSGTNHNARNLAVMELPVALLGRERLAPGDTLELDTVLTSHGQLQRIEWRGTFSLSE